MSKIIILSLALTMAAPAFAADHTPAEVAGSLVIGTLVGGVVVVAATVTGTKPQLCKKMGGTYKPTTDLSEQCPDGKWSNLLK